LNSKETTKKRQREVYSASSLFVVQSAICNLQSAISSGSPIGLLVFFVETGGGGG
jgi:hypothetical protein